MFFQNNPTATSNLSMLWASVLTETLSKIGVTQAVIAPGSRSAPVILALADHPDIETIPVLDERSAAFFALGLSKRSKKPTLLLTTSGTAGANAHPAVIEASQSNTPLIIITCERPTYMQSCSSRHTADQTHLFGSHARFFKTLDMPKEEINRFAYLRQTIQFAYQKSLDPTNPGPVHLNMPLDEALSSQVIPKERSWIQSQNWDGFFDHMQSPTLENRLTYPENLKDLNGRGIITAGAFPEDLPESEVNALLAFSEKSGWPILADGLSSLRYAKKHKNIITTYDTILRNTGLAETLKPEVHLQIGILPTSKKLEIWLKDQPNMRTYTLSPYNHNLDPHHRATTHLMCTLESLNEATSFSNTDTSYISMWRGLEEEASGEIRKKLDKMSLDFEGSAYSVLAEGLPEETPLFVAASMPSRDIEYFFPSSSKRLKPYANKGTSGIDGTLSTALGIAHRNKPAYLLTGDLAFLHDTNGCLLQEVFDGQLTVILINNNGGGIFEALPISKDTRHYERYIATPQTVDIQTLAKAYGIAYENPKTKDAFRELITRPCNFKIRIIEIHTDRKASMTSRQTMFNQVEQQLTSCQQQPVLN